MNLTIIQHLFNIIMLIQLFYCISKRNFFFIVASDNLFQKISDFLVRVEKTIYHK